MTTLSPTRAEEAALCGRCQEREATQTCCVPGGRPYRIREDAPLWPEEAPYCDQCASVRQEEVTQAREWRGFRKALIRKWRPVYGADIVACSAFILDGFYPADPKALLTAPQDAEAAERLAIYWSALSVAQGWLKLARCKAYGQSKEMFRRYIATARRHRIEAAQLRKVA